MPWALIWAFSKNSLTPQTSQTQPMTADYGIQDKQIAKFLGNRQFILDFVKNVKGTSSELEGYRKV